MSRVFHDRQQRKAARDLERAQRRSAGSDYAAPQYAPDYAATDTRLVSERIGALPTDLALPMAEIRRIGNMPGGKFAVFGRREIAAELKRAGWRNVGGDTWSPPEQDAEPS